MSPHDASTYFFFLFCAPLQDLADYEVEIVEEEVPWEVRVDGEESIGLSPCVSPGPAAMAANAAGAAAVAGGASARDFDHNGERVLHRSVVVDANGVETIQEVIAVKGVRHDNIISCHTTNWNICFIFGSVLLTRLYSPLYTLFV